MATRLTPGSVWSIRKSTSKVTARRSGSASTSAIPTQFLQSKDVWIDEELDAEPKAGRRATASPELSIEVDVKPGEASVVAIRHASGALTFHQSIERSARGVSRNKRGTKTVEVDRYRIQIRPGSTGIPSRRGLVSKLIKVVILKVAKAAIDEVASRTIAFLARQLESRVWSQRGLQEGWFKVSVENGVFRLVPDFSTPKPGERSLLFIHGTFSNTVSAFSSLGSTDFFERVRPIYGDRIFAFNHFSVSRTPIDNATMLVAGLKSGQYPFDAITHSRGGLVLRALVEQRDQLGSPSVIVDIGHAVLVASPNDGTPLATPNRWKETMGWIANILELFPENPLTTGAEFISEGIVWLAAHISNDLPGLHSMDSAGNLIVSLQLPPGPPSGVYSALVSNFHPDDALFARAIDVGVDTFFASANDLVVPSEGGWRVDHDGTTHIPGGRIGCFGAGGNITATTGTMVHHLNLFDQSGTVEFIANALAGKPQGRPSIDPTVPLPSRILSRRSLTAPAADIVDKSSIADLTTSQPLAVSTPQLLPLEDDFDTFHIVVMDGFDTVTGERKAPGQNPNFAQVYATYGGARVTVSMRLRQNKNDKTTKTYFPKIIGTHERIRNYTNFEAGSLPTDQELKVFGAQLFNTLFQGDVRRLYDEARSRQRGRRLDLVLTSMVSWVGEKPWEFAYDDTRNAFLATEEIHFIRNVLTSIPADAITPVNGPLRILVAAAQPVAFGRLSIDEEIEVIRRGFDVLVESNLVTIDVLTRATPAALHGYLSTGRYNIVHFIGHGGFNEDKGEGCLIFEDTRGGDYVVGERSLREIFCQRGLSLVFLNACQSGTGGRADFNKGVAQAMVSHGLPALVANQYSVLDSSATSFAQHFYFSLAQGMSLGQAAREARIAVNYALQGESIDWAIPVLYARDANRTLCVKSSTPIRVPTTAVKATSRRAVKNHLLKIAVWDIDEVFPELEKTLHVMNAAQDVYGFQETRLSLPLDVWDLEYDPGTPYLDASKLAKRLKSKPGQLHVDLLICITRHLMSDGEWFGLYAWWSDDHLPKLAVFACAGFDDLKPKGLETDRVIANNVVSILAGFFGNLDTHTGGRKNCPLASNMSVEWSYIAGNLEFDARCRSKLRGLHRGAQLRAMDALLKVFS